MANEKPFGVTNIKSSMPIVLDLEELNYTSWRRLFETHCESFDVDGHLNGKSLPKNPKDLAWKKLDSLIKMWIYSTIKPNILNMIIKKGDTAQTVWKSIENLFQDNKDALANELESELRSIEIGDKTISDYCQRIKVISDLLDNIDEPVSDKLLVRCMLNGLSEKYEHVAGITRHQKPMPTFLEARSMLMMEESRLNRRRPTSQLKDTSSSPTVLLVGNNNGSNSNNGPQVCWNFQLGHCQFGERCKFIHGTNDQRWRNNNNKKNNGQGVVFFDPRNANTNVQHVMLPGPLTQPQEVHYNHS